MNTIKKAADINICLGLVLENKNNSIRVQLFKLFIEKGIDPNTAVDRYNTTLLMWAAENEELDLLNLFIEKGIDPTTAADSYNTTLLMWAAKNEQLDLLNLFIEKGIDPNTAVDDHHSLDQTIRLLELKKYFEENDSVQIIDKISDLDNENDIVLALEAFYSTYERPIDINIIPDVLDKIEKENSNIDLSSIIIKYLNYIKDGKEIFGSYTRFSHISNKVLLTLLKKVNINKLDNEIKIKLFNASACKHNIFDDYEWFTYLFDNGFIEPITIYKNFDYINNESLLSLAIMQSLKKGRKPSATNFKTRKEWEKLVIKIIDSMDKENALNNLNDAFNKALPFSKDDPDKQLIKDKWASRLTTP